jgi:hypothetical protein
LLGDQSSEKVEQATVSPLEQKPPVRIREKFAQSSTIVSSSVPSSAATTSVVNTTGVGQVSSSGAYSGYPTTPLPYVSYSQVLPQHPTGVPPPQLGASHFSPAPVQSFTPGYPQVLASNQMQPPSVTSYSGYGGVYPEAPPLQQVAQALQRPPLPVSVKPPSSTALLATLTKAQSSSIQDKYSEKQPAQRRKFQEFPVGAKDSSGEEQVGRAKLTCCC